MKHSRDYWLINVTKIEFSNDLKQYYEDLTNLILAAANVEGTCNSVGKIHRNFLAMMNTITENRSRFISRSSLANPDF